MGADALDGGYPWLGWGTGCNSRLYARGSAEEPEVEQRCFRIIFVWPVGCDGDGWSSCAGAGGADAGLGVGSLYLGLRGRGSLIANVDKFKVRPKASGGVEEELPAWRDSEAKIWAADL
jgi:hypothetical protein